MGWIVVPPRDSPPACPASCPPSCGIHRVAQWPFHAGWNWEGRGAGAQAHKSWLGPPNVAALLTHCGQSIRRKISKFAAIRCQILRLKCTKFDFRPPSCVYGGLLLREGRGRVRKGERGERKVRGGGKGWRERKGKGGSSPHTHTEIFWPRSARGVGSTSV